MRVKVQGGTVQHGDSSLCNTCGHAKIIHGETINERIVECNASVMNGMLIPFRVTSCSAYSDKRQPSYMEMVRMAWILTPYATKRRPAGFVRGEDLTRRELSEVLAGNPEED